LHEQHALKLYEVYMERIHGLEHQTLADDWDGTFRHTSK